MNINYLTYIKNWIKRPIFQGLEEDRNALQSIISEVENLYQTIDTPVAWAKINDMGDLYDLRLQNNPYDNQAKIIPLYRINK